MKKNIQLLFGLLIIILVFSSCSGSSSEGETTEEIDACTLLECQENASVVDCACVCDEGYLGEDCTDLDVAFTQKYLNDGISPFDLLDANIPIDSVYGKVFQDGIIFKLNTVSKIVKVTAITDSPETLNWPEAIDYCEAFEVNDYTDWYLPDLQELGEIRTKLYAELKVGDFNDDFYWSSETQDSDPNNAMAVFFLNGNVGPIEKARVNPVSYNHVRPVRSIEE
ncbi:DUF1566 domain-containing protein [Polaribacter dokdonensis]|uniref:Protein serine/threonine phosphatase n=1 Tax=Polaribacter dokdonensis DSW-5 TaxID=1300348 RepID=A0A0N0CFY2_9FLAO|nr:DUF1566 domain-containing protein [Polaribacter dokdonensis]KOY52508.1 Protein serine/threonine phosphatase [Polaribacter dokdonensis DSW-5]SEE46847.1 Protein of unknown function [Polaribacter dokdonensis DSW-5]